MALAAADLRHPCEGYLIATRRHRHVDGELLEVTTAPALVVHVPPLEVIVSVPAKFRSAPILVLLLLPEKCQRGLNFGSGTISVIWSGEPLRFLEARLGGGRVMSRSSHYT